MKNIIKILIIIILLVIGVFGVRMLTKEEAVSDNIMFDLEALSTYESLYVGDNSNTTQLFNDLMLSDKNKYFKIDADLFKVIITFDNEIKLTDESLIHKSMVYNSVVAFSLIENLEIINYDFGYDIYEVSRDEAELWFDFELKSIYKNQTNVDTLMLKIDRKEFVEDCVRDLKVKNNEIIKNQIIIDKSDYAMLVNNRINGVYINREWIRFNMFFSKMHDIKAEHIRYMSVLFGRDLSKKEYLLYLKHYNKRM